MKGGGVEKGWVESKGKGVVEENRQTNSLLVIGLPPHVLRQENIIDLMIILLNTCEDEGATK